MFNNRNSISNITGWAYRGKMIKINRPNNPDSIVFGIFESWASNYIINYRRIIYNGNLSSETSSWHINRTNEYISPATKEEVAEYFKMQLDDEIRNDKLTIRRLKENIKKNKRSLGRLEDNIFVSMTEYACTPDEAEKARRIKNRQNKKVNKKQ